MAQISERGKGRFLVRVFLGRDAVSGKRRYHNKTIRGTKTQGRTYATKIQAQVDIGTFAEPSRQTVAEFMEAWLEHTAPRKVRPYTLADYKAITKRYIDPVLGGVRLGRLTPSDVQKLVTHLEAKDLSPRTVRYTVGILRNALNIALRDGRITSNPASAKLLDLPKSRRRELTVTLYPG